MLELYKGILKQDASSGAGGNALDQNFIELANRIGPSNYAAVLPPTADDDSAHGYFVGSRWVDLSTNRMYDCVQDTPGDAVWVNSAIDAYSEAEVDTFLATINSDITNAQNSANTAITNASTAQFTIDQHLDNGIHNNQMQSLTNLASGLDGIIVYDEDGNTPFTVGPVNGSDPRPSMKLQCETLADPQVFEMTNASRADGWSFGLESATGDLSIQRRVSSIPTEVINIERSTGNLTTTGSIYSSSAIAAALGFNHQLDVWHHDSSGNDRFFFAGYGTMMIRALASSPNPLINILNFSYGSVLTISEGGAVACNGMSVQGTSITKILTATASLDYGSIAAGAEATLTISVTGATTTGTPVVLLGWSGALPDGISVKQAWVSAADTVSIRVANRTAGAIDPGALTCRATIFIY